jgi:hypothetical protein
MSGTSSGIAYGGRDPEGMRLNEKTYDRVFYPRIEITLCMACVEAFLRSKGSYDAHWDGEGTCSGRITVPIRSCQYRLAG